jgi:hypothetical protein
MRTGACRLADMRRTHPRSPSATGPGGVLSAASRADAPAVPACREAPAGAHPAPAHSHPLVLRPPTPARPARAALASRPTCPPLAPPCPVPPGACSHRARGPEGHDAPLLAELVQLVPQKHLPPQYRARRIDSGAPEFSGPALRASPAPAGAPRSGRRRPHRAEPGARPGKHVGNPDMNLCNFVIDYMTRRHYKKGCVTTTPGKERCT